MKPAQLLELASRNDGYLVIAGDPVVTELVNAGLITVRYFGDGCLIARAAKIPKHDPFASVRGMRGVKKWSMAIERGAVLA